MPILQDKAESDTLTLLLANAIHRNATIKARATQIKRTAKLIQKRTKCSTLESACRSIRNAATDGLVVQALELAEYKYFSQKREQRV